VNTDTQGPQLSTLNSQLQRIPLDKILCADSRSMDMIPDGCITLIICSPPYNVRKPYESHDDDLPLPEYLALLRAVWKECWRVLREGGRICVNVAGCWRQPYLPLHHLLGQQLSEVGFLMRGEIIWNKGSSVGVSTAWGSFASPSNPVLRDVHEYILVFSKGDFRLANPHSENSPQSRKVPKPPSEAGMAAVGLAKRKGFGGGVCKPHLHITNADFVEWTKSIWTFPAENAARVGHPTPFPVELPRRLILLYSHPGDIVLDPFMGSGTTCVAAKMLGRHYIGIDIDSGYVRVARRRLAQEQLI